MKIWQLMSLGVVIRLGLLVYGEWQDRSMAVKYTDVDYHVFNDAAKYMAQGQSPYLRSTYRYTPLLAVMLLPNIWISPIFGKLLFITFDSLTGYLLYILILNNTNSASKAKICSALWIFNPLPMTVSTRGNAESIMSFLVLLCLKLMQDNKVIQAGLVYAVSVHMKIYPVTYALPIYLWLGVSTKERSHRNGLQQGLKLWIHKIIPTKRHFYFILPSLLTLLALTAIFYNWYGWQFLEHTYLYHVTRKDIRHNFSPYFYMMYLQSGADNSVLLGLLAFLPQVLLLLVFSCHFYREPSLAFYLNTIAFVTFNKVCTSQYFLWYLCLLPLLLPNLASMTKVKATFTTVVWFLGQAIWLLPAYYLEFQGQNTFLYIWLAGLVFFIINCYTIYVMIDHYTPCVHGPSSQHRESTQHRETTHHLKTTQHRDQLQHIDASPYEKTKHNIDTGTQNMHGMRTRSQMNKMKIYNSKS